MTISNVVVEIYKPFEMRTMTLREYNGGVNVVLSTQMFLDFTTCGMYSQYVLPGPILEGTNCAID